MERRKDPKIEVFSGDSLKGRGFRALSSISQGAAVLEEDPYVYILNEEQLQLRCEKCLRAFTSDRISEEGLRACKTCKKAFYCSRSCQLAGSAEHRFGCKLLRGQTKDHKEVTLRLLTKIILKNKEHKPKKSSKSLNGFPTSFDDLCSCKISTKAQEYILSLFREYEQDWRGKIRTRVTPIRSGEVLDVYERLTPNSFSVYDEMRRTVIGEAVYFSGSLFNHSCDPNCTFVFDGTRLSVRAIRKIEAGEELCISYMSSLLPTQARRDKLRSIYGFTCHCLRCLDTQKDLLARCVRCPSPPCPAPVLPMQDGLFQMCHTCHSIISSLDHSTAVERLEAFTEEVLQEVKKSQQETVEINSYMNDSRLAVVLKQCIRQQASLLHPTHHCALRVGLEAVAVFSRLERWGEALEVSGGILEGLSLQLSKEDPYIGFYLLKLSIVHSNLGDSGMVHQLLAKAIPMLEVSYGENHPVTLHAKQLRAKSS